MLHWLDSLLPHLPHYGFVLIFLVVFLSNIGVPFPGKVILLGAGFVWGRTTGALWEPMLAGILASLLGGDRRQSTIGNERFFNPTLQPRTETEFVHIANAHECGLSTTISPRWGQSGQRQSRHTESWNPGREDGR
jgi:hypothetical protein